MWQNEGPFFQASEKRASFDPEASDARSDLDEGCQVMDRPLSCSALLGLALQEGENLEIQSHFSSINHFVSGFRIAVVQRKEHSHW